MKPRIIGTGLSGLVGSRLVELLSDQFEFEDLSLETGVDLTDLPTLNQKFNQTEAKVCLHLAAATNVDSCEQEKNLGKESLSWKLNVDATAEIARVAKKKGLYLVAISTEFVFSGRKPIEEGYDEKDQPQPINWYGETKYQGELRVQEIGGQYLIARIASPFRNEFPAKKDFVRAIRARLEQGLAVPGVEDARFTPTFVDDLALALPVVIRTQPTGILHLVGSASLSPYQAAQVIAELYHLPKRLIQPVTNAAFFSGRARRGLNLSLANQKAIEMGIRMRTFKEGLDCLVEK